MICLRYKAKMGLEFVGKTTESITVLAITSKTTYF